MAKASKNRVEKHPSVVELDGEVFFRRPNSKDEARRNYYFSRKGRLLHRVIWEKHHNKTIPRGYVIHHKDFNPLNNDINNLECMTNADHTRLHSLRNWEEGGVCRKPETMIGLSKEQAFIELLVEFKKMGVKSATFSNGNIESIVFGENTMEKRTNTRQDKPKELSEEDRQRNADRETLKKAELLDDLLLEDPISYEEALIREGMVHNGEQNG